MATSSCYSKQEEQGPGGEEREEERKEEVRSAIKKMPAPDQHELDPDCLKGLWKSILLLQVTFG